MVIVILSIKSGFMALTKQFILWLLITFKMTRYKRFTYQRCSSGCLNTWTWCCWIHIVEQSVNFPHRNTSTTIAHLEQEGTHSIMFLNTILEKTVSLKQWSRESSGKTSYKVVPSNWQAFLNSHLSYSNKQVHSSLSSFLQTIYIKYYRKKHS